MAVDSRDKRAAIVRWGFPYGDPLPEPTGFVGLSGRQRLAGTYAGFAASADWTLRASAVGHLFPWLRLPGTYPDGSVAATDRQFIAGFYVGIAAIPPVSGAMGRLNGIGRAIMRGIGRFR